MTAQHTRPTIALSSKNTFVGSKCDVPEAFVPRDGRRRPEPTCMYRPPPRLTVGRSRMSAEL